MAGSGQLEINSPLCILIGSRSVSNIKSSIRDTNTPVSPVNLPVVEILVSLPVLGTIFPGFVKVIQVRVTKIVSEIGWMPGDSLGYLRKNNYGRQLLYKLPWVGPGETLNYIGR